MPSVAFFLSCLWHNNHRISIKFHSILIEQPCSIAKCIKIRKSNVEGREAEKRENRKCDENGWNQNNGNSASSNENKIKSIQFDFVVISNQSHLYMFVVQFASITYASAATSILPHSFAIIPCNNRYTAQLSMLTTEPQHSMVKNNDDSGKSIADSILFKLSQNEMKRNSTDRVGKSLSYNEIERTN